MRLRRSLRLVPAEGQGGAERGGGEKPVEPHGAPALPGWTEKLWPAAGSLAAKTILRVSTGACLRVAFGPGASVVGGRGASPCAVGSLCDGREPRVPAALTPARRGSPPWLLLAVRALLSAVRLRRVTAAVLPPRRSLLDFPLSVSPPSRVSGCSPF